MFFCKRGIWIWIVYDINVVWFDMDFYGIVVVVFVIFMMESIYDCFMKCLFGIGNKFMISFFFSSF